MTRRCRVPRPERSYSDGAVDNVRRDSDSDFDGTYKQKQRGGCLSRAGSDLSDSFGRLSISATTNHCWGRQSSLLDYDSDGGRSQRSGPVFQKWMRGAADAKTVLRELGYGGRGDGVERRPSPPQKKPASLPPGQYNGDAPLVDLHIHIDHNNIGSMAFGMDDKKDSKK